jgi:penicillin-binding protein 1C
VKAVLRRHRRKLLVAAVTCAALLAAWRILRASVGEPSARLDETWNQGHRIVDRNGRVLRELPSAAGARGRPVALDEVGDRLLLATLVSEDKRFYEHGGVDPRAIVRAMGQNVTHLRLVSGASTITQQLVKLLDAGGEAPGDRTLLVKAREAARAENLEEEMTKSQILEAYFNRLNYGRGLVGPDAAANAYFGVSPRDLSWAQAALLAVLPRAPSSLDPYTHLDRALLRQRALLADLRAEGVLQPADHARASAEAIVVRPLERPFAAPYLVEALRLGHHGGLASGSVTQTTLDLELQTDVEGLCDSHVERLAPKNASSAAVIVVDNATGEVLSYVGGAGFDDERHGQVDMARARRQPGSALKPFAYAMAFERGLEPTAMLADVPTRFGERAGAWAPVNFDGTFWGPVSAREALAGSLNIPAVRVAASLDDGAFLARLHRAGIASLDRSAAHYGLALVLGSGEVTLVELAQAYAVLARGGEGLTLRFQPGDGAAQTGERVFDAAAAASVGDILSDPRARIRGLGSVGPFDVGFPVAVKTGTSSGFRDGWAVGYTHERTVGVWVGNPDGAATGELTGGAGAGPLFADVMRRAMRDVAPRAPLWEAALLEEVAVCPLSGKVVTSACPEAVKRRLPAGHVHTEACTLHHHASPRSAPPNEPPWRCDADGRSVIVTLPLELGGWLAAQPLGAPGRDLDGIPWYAAAAVPGCGDARESAATLRIEDPAPGSVLLAGDGASVELAAAFDGTATLRVEFVLDGRVVASVARPPYRAHVNATRGDHELVVRPADPDAPVRLAASRFSVR